MNDDHDGNFNVNDWHRWAVSCSYSDHHSWVTSLRREIEDRGAGESFTAARCNLVRRAVTRVTRMEKNRRRNRHKVGQDGNLAGIRGDTQLDGDSPLHPPLVLVRKKIGDREFLKAYEIIERSRAFASPFSNGYFSWQQVSHFSYVVRKILNTSASRASDGRWFVNRPSNPR